MFVKTLETHSFYCQFLRISVFAQLITPFPEKMSFEIIGDSLKSVIGNRAEEYHTFVYASGLIWAFSQKCEYTILFREKKCFQFINNPLLIGDSEWFTKEATL